MKRVLVNMSLMLGSVLFFCCLLEFGWRVSRGEWRFHNHLAEMRQMLQAANNAQYDARLGWVPGEGNRGKNAWKTEVTVLPGGVRSNGDGARIPGPDEPVILAVGDSFTFGDEVSDGDTWTAALERRLGVPVINGGVPGYGVDQSYLRLQELLSTYSPDRIIFGLIPDDVLRTQRSVNYGVPKPYYTLAQDGQLELHLDHMPLTQPPPTALGVTRSVLGYSFFAHRLLSRRVPGWWLRGSFAGRVQVHDRGMDVSCAIFSRLAGLSQEQETPIYILLQYTPMAWVKEDLVDFNSMIDRCVDRDSLILVDSMEPLRELEAADPEAYARLYTWHMNRAGNEFTASLLVEAVAARR